MSKLPPKRKNYRSLLRRDPSRTTPLQRKFIRTLTREYNAIVKDIAGWIIEDDKGPTGNSWSLSPKGNILERFLKWLKKRLEIGGIEKTTEGFIQQSYERGINNGIKATVKPAEASALESSGWLKRVLRGRTTVDRLKILRTQAAQKIKSLNEFLTSKVVDSITEGMINGEHPSVIARTIVKELPEVTKTQATRIVRTEVIRAHAEGALDSMEALGVESIGVLVEWSTAGDGKVCPKCRPLEGIIIPIARAHGMFPRHPNCRCTPIPAFVKFNRDKLRAAVQKSLEAGSSKKSAATLSPSGGSWPGPAVADLLKSGD